MGKHEYRLVRSKRKTLAVYILPDTRVEVRAPLRMPLSAIEAFVTSRSEWIETHLKIAQDRLEQQADYSAGEGEKVLFLGKEYTVRLTESSTVLLTEGVFSLPMDERERRRALTEWYRRKALSHLPEIAEKWKSFTGVECRKVTVGGAASRWGSCNSKNDIRLSWRLILLPEELIDYVVVHELCHTLQHNHSPAFWNEVERFLPQCLLMRKKLREMERKYLCQMNWLNSV